MLLPKLKKYLTPITDQKNTATESRVACLMTQRRALLESVSRMAVVRLTNIF